VTVAPVIARELQAQARQASTYWLRVLGAGVLVLALGFWMTQGLFRISEPGAFLFWALNRFLLIAIWLAVPVLTAAVHAWFGGPASVPVNPII